MNEYISVAGLKAEGWTDGLVKKYLREPDKTAPNPHYRRAGAPMRLYLRSRVATKLKGKKLQGALADAAAKRAARRSAAERAVATKVLRAERKMQSAIEERLEQELSDWTWSRLVRAACASYNRGDGIPDWAYGKRDWADNHCGGASPDSDPEFLVRICCNFVRHQLLDYEAMLGGYVGSDAARAVAHDAVFKAVQALQHLTPEQEREREQRAREREQRAREREQRAREREQRARERDQRARERDQRARAEEREARERAIKAEQEQLRELKEKLERVAQLVPWASVRQQTRIAEYGCTTIEQCLAAARALGFQGDTRRWAGKI